jgi:hypothetical protein
MKTFGNTGTGRKDDQSIAMEIRPPFCGKAGDGQTKKEKFQFSSSSKFSDFRGRMCKLLGLIERIEDTFVNHLPISTYDAAG